MKLADSGLCTISDGGKETDMGEAIGQTLPLAVGLALSPVPIIAVVVTLTTPRARSSGPAFVLGWLVGLGVVGTIVLVIAGSNTGGDQDQPAARVRWLELVLGALLLALAVTQFRGRPRSGEQAPMPAWMNAVGRFTAGKVLGTGAVLAAPTRRTCCWPSAARPTTSLPRSAVRWPLSTIVSRPP